MHWNHAAAHSLRSLLFFALVAFATPPLRAADRGLRISASQKELHFSWNTALEHAVRLVELPLATGAKSGASATTVLARIPEGATTFDVPRFDGSRDRLYSKFELEDADSHRGVTAAQCVTDFQAGADPEPMAPRPASRKGLTCILDVADAVALGVHQANRNIDIGALIDWASQQPAESFEFEGRRVGLRPAAVRGLDHDLTQLHAAGMRVTGILLNYVSALTPRNSPLVHPLTDPAVVPIGPAAFNTATSEGLFYYRAILHWLVERYTREDAKFGRLGGLVIGNEVQSHWSWYHLGLVEPEVLIREYYTALRVADLATRSLHRDFPIYVSLEHHWTLPAADDRRKGFTAVEVLDGIAQLAQTEGDFPWNVAFHPYPENLGRPRFWNDKSAPLRFDAPRLTFHNLEVLPAYLRQPHFLYLGKVRRIALTEQGFHCPPGKDGEEAQAAAFALAWKKVQALPEIESFLYHRHVDHPHEGGLRCGVREHDGSANVGGIGRARKLWEVMQKAGTPDENAAFAFALPIIGRTGWKDVVATNFDPPRPVRREPGRLIYDFVEQREAAQQENLQSVEKRRIGPLDEVQQRALLEHPRAKGEGRLRYSVEIPAAVGSQRLLLVFDALLDHLRSSGARFAVRVNETEVFNRILAAGQRVPAEIDLARWAGKPVSVDLVVDADKDPAYDWALWVAPRVVVRP